MRDTLYLIAFLLAAAVLLYLGRDLLQGTVFMAWGLAFGGTTVVSVLGLVVYRFRLELEVNRRALAQREAELSFALKVQRALFPREFPTTRGFEFSAVCIPAAGISGD